jgi:3-oxoacyl-[acyl-carrier protein] reductase
VKVAWVTGSAKRLGKSIALRLAQEGFFTWIHYAESTQEARATLLEVKQAGGDGALIQGNLGSEKSIQRMADALVRKSGRLDVLVQNVGVYRTGSLLGMASKDLADLFQTNTLSSVHLMRAALPLFPKTGGSFIAVGYSGLTGITGSAHNGAYLATKTALLSLVKSLALEFAPRQLRVNMVSPGILDNSVELPQNLPEFAPLGRLGKPSDVAETVAFLASEKASYITGVNLEVAGGYMLEMQTLKAKDLQTAAVKKNRASQRRSR